MKRMENWVKVSCHSRKLMFNSKTLIIIIIIIIVIVVLSREIILFHRFNYKLTYIIKIKNIKNQRLFGICQMDRNSCMKYKKHSFQSRKVSETQQIRPFDLHYDYSFRQLKLKKIIGNCCCCCCCFSIVIFFLSLYDNIYVYIIDRLSLNLLLQSFLRNIRI